MRLNFLVKFGVMLIIGAYACSSSHYMTPEVINNSDRTLKTPEWVLAQKILNEENGKIQYIFKLNLDGSSRPDACVAMAKSQAVAEMLKYIKSSLTASGQIEDLNSSSDPSYSSLTAFLSQGKISGAQTTDSYWEETMEGERDKANFQRKLLCAVKVQIDKQLLEKQLKEAITETPGGNSEIREKLIEAQKKFIDNAGSDD